MVYYTQCKIRTLIVMKIKHRSDPATHKTYKKNNNNIMLTILFSIYKLKEILPNKNKAMTDDINFY